MERQAFNSLNEAALQVQTGITPEPEINEAVLEYFSNYFGDNLNEDTSDEDIMQAVYDLIDLTEAVLEAHALSTPAGIRTRIKRTNALHVGLNKKLKQAQDAQFNNMTSGSPDSAVLGKGLKNIDKIKQRSFKNDERYGKAQTARGKAGMPTTNADISGHPEQFGPKSHLRT